MNTLCRSLLLVGLLGAGAAVADEGLRVSAEQTPWPRWQARLGLAASSAPASEAAGTSGQYVRGAKVLGDYYFSGPGFGAGNVAGGFRATSGVMFGRPAVLPGMVAFGTPRGISLALSHATGAAQNGSFDTSEGITTAPYLGVGYTSLSIRGGWGFSADIGLMAVSPGSGLRVRNGSAQNTRGVDEVMRDWQLTPLVQLGVSYSF